MADTDLNTINATLGTVIKQQNIILQKLESQEEVLEELIVKVDELNLPSGEGYSIERES